MQPKWATWSDGELLRAADEEAFRAFYLRHERTVVAYLARRTGDAELAADLTAETFAAAFLHAKRFQDEGQSAIAWLLGIARHALLHSLERRRNERSARRRLRVEPTALSDASLERVEALIDSEDPANPLWSLLEELPADQREAVRGRVLDERTYHALARELRVSAPAVRQRVSRGLASLRSALQQEAR